jgi:DNA-binding transcriptional MerR regulator
MDGFTETTGSLARKAGVLPETIRLYADRHLIECERLANGVRMFRPSAALQVQRILAERLGRRGGRQVSAS